MIKKPVRVFHPCHAELGSASELSFRGLAAESNHLFGCPGPRYQVAG